MNENQHISQFADYFFRVGLSDGVNLETRRQNPPEGVLFTSMNDLSHQEKPTRNALQNMDTSSRNE